MPTKRNFKNRGEGTYDRTGRFLKFVSRHLILNKTKNRSFEVLNSLKLLKMSKISRKLLIIVSMVLILGTIFAIPLFAETQDELKEIFVTREEWDKWINVDGYSDASTKMGMSEYLDRIENLNQVRLQTKVLEEYLRRGLKLPTEESITTP